MLDSFKKLTLEVCQFVKKLLMTTIGCMALLLAGCNDKEEIQDANKDKQEQESVEVDRNEVEEEKDLVEFSQAPSDAAAIIEAGAGVKMKEILGSSTEKLKPEDLVFMEEFPVENLTMDEMYNGIVEWFAMDYTAVHDPLVNFEPNYGEYGIDKREKKQLNIAVLIDASGSMKAMIGGEQMMALAKDAVKRFGAGLPEESIISLRVYGHEGTGSSADKAMSCSSNELIYQPDFYNEAEFTNALTKFEAAGWTPLAAAIKAGGEDLRVKASEKTQNMIFVVSDGVETCGGDPVAEAKMLAESDLGVEVNVIGFNVDSEGQKKLKKVADEGNGKYANVKSTIDFQNTFQSMLEEANAVVREMSQKVNHGMQIDNRTIKLNDEVLKLASSFYDFAALENSNMRAAVSVLRKSDRIDNETQFELVDKLDERREMMNDYGESLKKEKLELIKQTRQQLYESMD